MKKIKTYLFPSIVAFMVAITISLSGSVSQYSSLKQMLLAEIDGVGFDDLIILIALILFFSKSWTVFMQSRHWITDVLSAVFSIFMLIGISYSKLGNWDFIFANVRQCIVAFIAFLGYFILFDVFLSILYKLLAEKHLFKTLSKYKFPDTIDNHYYLFAFIVIVLFWLPYVLFHLPGSVPYDGYRQINMFYNIEPLSNHHPWVLTVFFGFLMNIGKIVSDNFGVLLIVSVMFIVEASCYATICSKIKKWGAPFYFNLLTLLFFAILPVFGAYSQIVMKDGIFSALFALFFVLYVDLCISYVKKDVIEHPVQKFAVLLIIELLVCITRNNGIYMIIPANILLLFFTIKGRKKYVILLTLCLLLSYYCIDSRLAAAVGVAPGSDKEMLSIPFQQTARYLKEYPDDVTESEEKAIRAILDYDNLAQIYEPEISDHVKDTFRNSSSKEDLSNYFKAWFSMFCRHPGVYFEATFNNTYGYYYPFHNCNKLGAYQFYIQGPPLATVDFDIHYVIPANIRQICDTYATIWRNIPGLAQLVNPGSYTWGILILGGYLIYRKRSKGLLVLAAPLLNVAVCIASPVNGYLRYAIPLIACTPVLIYWCLRYAETKKAVRHLEQAAKEKEN